MRPFVEKYRDILLDVTGNLFVIGLILLLLHHFTSIIVSVWIEISLLAIITVTSGFSWFFIFIQKDEEYFKTKTEPYFRNLFLAGLLIITVGSLTSEFIEGSELLSSVVSFIPSIQFYLVLLTIGFGFFTFYFNKEWVELETEQKEKQEEIAFLTELKFNNSTLSQNRLEKNDYIFLIGLGLLILFLLIEHPMTPSFSYNALLFWMAFSMLLKSMLLKGGS